MDETKISEEVSVGYGNNKLRLRGISAVHIFQILIFILCFGGISAQLWQMHYLASERAIDSARRDEEVRKLILNVISNQEKILTEIAFTNKATETAIKESSEAQIYVLSLPQQKREALNLQMPRVIREQKKRLRKDLFED